MESSNVAICSNFLFMIVAIGFPTQQWPSIAPRLVDSPLEFISVRGHSYSYRDTTLRSQFCNGIEIGRIKNHI
jgi:hypothetical protein